MHTTFAIVHQIGDEKIVSTQVNGVMTIFAACISILFFLSSAAHSQEKDESKVLARIGPRTITVQEYLERIDLMPWPGKDNPATRDEAKIKAMASLVAEKLMSIQAADRGFIQNQNTVPALRALERVLARDALHKTEIMKKISVDAAEIDEGLKRYGWIVTLNSFVMDSENDARRLAAELNAHRDAIAVPISAEGVMSHDTIRVGFGDLLESYERTAFEIDTLKEAQVVFTQNDGWAVLQLLDKSVNDAYVKGSGDERREAVKRIAKKRKETELTKHFLRRVFEEKVQMDSSAFHILADSLRAILLQDSASRRHEGFYGLRVDDVGRLTEALGRLQQKTFITMGAYSLAVGDVVDELNFFPVRFSSLRRVSFLQTLNQSLQTIAEAALLSQVAVKRGMHLLPDVQRELSIWVDAIQADRFLKHLVDSLGRENSDSQSVAGDTLRDLSNSGAVDAINRHISRLADAYKVEIYLDQLKDVSISPINLVTRRFIGFGGGMMGMPILWRLWEWLDTWNISKKISP